ncbi:MAG: 50S ribosomal protein L9 [Clostridia bacterium]
MKLLLLQDVKGTGKTGQVVTVSDGYAHNFLIPKGMAAPADANNINAANIKLSAKQHQLKVARDNAEKLASDMSGLTVKIVAKAGANGKLFGSIGANEIAEGLKCQYGIEVDKKKIRLDEPIKSLGMIEVTAHMYERTDAKFKVEVIPL